MYNSSFPANINGGDVLPLKKQMLKNIKQNNCDLNLDPYN